MHKCSVQLRDQSPADIHSENNFEHEGKIKQSHTGTAEFYNKPSLGYSTVISHFQFHTVRACSPVSSRVMTTSVICLPSIGDEKAP